MVEYFNFFYFLYIVIAFGLFIGLYLLLRNKSEKTAYIVLLGLLLASFALHFLKLGFYHYQRWMPYAIRTITPENYCAVSVLVFPWFFISKNKLLKDYMFYFGVLGGLGATFYPIDAVGMYAFEFETMRFYFSHILIWVVPALMVMLGLHTLDYRRILKAPFLVYLVMGVILVNEIVLVGAGFVRIEHLFSHEIRNPALIFGPLPQVDLVGVLLTSLTPELFLTVPVGENAGATFYWPIVWLMIPFYIYFVAAAFAMSLPFQFKRIKEDILTIKSKINPTKG